MSFDIRKAKRRDTAPFALRRLSPDPQAPITLHVRHLGMTNQAFVDAEFKRARKEASKEAPEIAGSAALADGRVRDIAKIAEFCVAAWDNVTQDGAPAPCTPDSVLAFLQFALENSYENEIDELRAFVGNQDNFRDPLPKASDLGKG